MKNKLFSTLILLLTSLSLILVLPTCSTLKTTTICSDYPIEETIKD